ncbi:NADH:ubiquinone oxidoreductase subunit NDUFA12 [Allosphingosinicella sp.]|uniref:NADH:ubiquinone oxidoreductase subunit NDUFA12 n=1 Tax=Allosphingosinicella sp. TaxID=2823234 RepID=UPI00378454F5
MGFFKNLFTWWDGATLGTALFSARHGSKVGEDALGNRYFEGKGRRWVMYAGSNDVSRVPPEWYAWLTRQIDVLPDDLPPPPKFLRPATPNLTGTAGAYRPTGAMEKGGIRQAASGDYQAWTPD